MSDDEKTDTPAAAPELDGVTLESEISRQVTLTWRCVEEIDMRLATLQIEVAVLIGITLLAIAAAALQARRKS